MASLKIADSVFSDKIDALQNSIEDIASLLHQDVALTQEINSENTAMLNAFQSLGGIVFPLVNRLADIQEGNKEIAIQQAAGMEHARESIKALAEIQEQQSSDLNIKLMAVTDLLGQVTNALQLMMKRETIAPKSISPAPKKEVAA
jgi:DNA-directed RNA polymerase beta' subunit